MALRESTHEISGYRSSRRELWELFVLAEEFPAVIEELIDQGRVLVATLGGEAVGSLQLLDPDIEGEIELAILAVAEPHQGRGIGTALVEQAITTDGIPLRDRVWLTLAR